MSSDKPEIYGLIGYPVKHSLSPLMHNAAFAALNIQAEYKLFPLKEEELEGFLQSLGRNNIGGLNVTVPYKEKVIPFLSSVSDEAGLIGAVNTINVAQDRLEGFNTDGEGFLTHLACDLKFDPAAKNIALIGAGGAARAVSVCLSKKNPKSVTLYDIKKDKARDLAGHLEKSFAAVEFRAAGTIEEIDIKGCDLLINATPIGMKEDDPCLIGRKFLHGGLLVYDLIYNPRETNLLKTAKEEGATVSNGLGMLLHQGARAFKVWTNLPAPLEVMRKALEGGVKNI